MKGKRILVTGASSGIGFQIAKDLLQMGATVGAHYRENRSSVEKLLDYAGPEQCKIFQAEFNHTDQVMRLWSQYIEWSQGIDVLINNAGEAAKPEPVNKLSEDAWDQTFHVNVKAPWLLSRAALSVMTEQGSGRIINMSSVGVKFGGGIETVHYSASKSALEAITKSFAKAGAPHNVLVNAVRAGVTETSMHEKIGRHDMSSRTNLIPLKRMAQPSEISQVVLFLAGEESSYVTGTILTAAGGE